MKLLVQAAPPLNSSPGTRASAAEKPQPFECVLETAIHAATGRYADRAPANRATAPLILPVTTLPHGRLGLDSQAGGTEKPGADTFQVQTGPAADSTTPAATKKKPEPLQPGSGAAGPSLLPSAPAGETQPGTPAVPPAAIQLPVAQPGPPAAVKQQADTSRSISKVAGHAANALHAKAPLTITATGKPDAASRPGPADPEPTSAAKNDAGSAPPPTTTRKLSPGPSAVVREAGFPGPPPTPNATGTVSPRAPSQTGDANKPAGAGAPAGDNASAKQAPLVVGAQSAAPALHGNTGGELRTSPALPLSEAAGDGGARTQTLISSPTPVHLAGSTVREDLPPAAAALPTGAAHTFARLDAGAPWNVTALRSDARNLEVGVQSGSLGWVEVRATSDAQGQVSASLHAQSELAAQSLASQVEHITAYAQQHATAVDQVSVGVNTGGGSQPGDRGTQGYSHRTAEASASTSVSAAGGAGEGEDVSLSLISVRA